MAALVERPGCESVEEGGDECGDDVAENQDGKWPFRSLGGWLLIDLIWESSTRCRRCDLGGGQISKGDDRHYDE